MRFLIKVLKCEIAQTNFRLRSPDSRAKTLYGGQITLLHVTLLMKPNISSFYTQLFQLTLSDQSIKLQNKTARLYGILFMNKFHQNQECIARSVKIYDGEPFG